MTDRIAAFTVVLDRDIREDDVEPLLTAIRLLRGVLTVEPHVASLDMQIAHARAKAELRSAMLKGLDELT